MAGFPKRPPRLPLDRYTGEHTVAFTACIRDRAVHFVSDEIVAPHVDCLRRACERGHCFCPIYCFMPDHVHIMFKGLDASSNLLASMRHFKLTSGIVIARQGSARWQESFYDHVLRSAVIGGPTLGTSPRILFALGLWSRHSSTPSSGLSEAIFKK